MDESISKNYSPLVLAYLGDAVYVLYVRIRVARGGRKRPKTLSHEATRYVCAAAQARIADELQPYLSEEEIAIYRRGRNAHPSSVARSASVVEYRKATGLEALCGYWYLSGETARMEELLSEVMKEETDHG